MPKHRAPSVRDLAKAIGLSKATVANALSGSRTVAAATAEKVHAAAAGMGYKRNPMVGAFMSAMRRSRGSAFQGMIAIVEMTEPNRPQHGPFHHELVRGCSARADELGFTAEFFQLSPSGTTARRLNSILKARGIRGIVLLPTWSPPDFSKFDWSFFTGVYADYIAGKPVMHSVCCDHYRSMLELLQQLKLRDYRRPGLVLEIGRDERVHSRASAALRTFQSSFGCETPVPPLLAAAVTPEVFAQWVKSERPDVILSHDSAQLSWIKSLGLRVPEDIGFVILNLAKAKCPSAALNLHPDQIGKCAVEILIGQIQRQASGMPRFPTTTTIIGDFVDGETIRKIGVSRENVNRPLRSGMRTAAAKSGGC